MSSYIFFRASKNSSPVPKASDSRKEFRASVWKGRNPCTGNRAARVSFANGARRVLTRLCFTARDPAVTQSPRRRRGGSLWLDRIERNGGKKGKSKAERAAKTTLGVLRSRKRTLRSSTFDFRRGSTCLRFNSRMPLPREQDSCVVSLCGGSCRARPGGDLIADFCRCSLNLEQVQRGGM